MGARHAKRISGCLRCDEVDLNADCICSPERICSDKNCAYYLVKFEHAPEKPNQDARRARVEKGAGDVRQQ